MPQASSYQRLSSAGDFLVIFSKTRPLSNDLRKRWLRQFRGRKLPGSGVAVRCCGVVGGEVVAALSFDRLFWPGKMGGHRRPVLDPHRAFIVKRLDQTPHLTLHALKDELAERGVKVSHNAVWLFLRREGLRFKKNAVCS